MRRRLDADEVRRRLAGGPSAVRVGRRARRGDADDVQAREAIELALRVGELMVGLGAAAVDATYEMHRVLRTFGLDGCQVELTFTSITISYDPGPPHQPITLMRIVETRDSDYGRLGAVVATVRDLAEDPPGRDQRRESLEVAHARLDDVVAAPQRYRRWIVTVALSVFAGSVGIMLGGGLLVALVAGATTAAIDRVVWFLGRWGLPPFFLQAVGAAVAATVAATLYAVVPRLPFELEVLPPSLVVASGIIVLLAGLQLVGAAEDAISGFPLTAAARGFEVLVLTGGIVVGIVGVLDVARRLGVPLVLVDPAGPATPVAVQVAAAALAAFAWAIACYATMRAAGVAVVVGALSWLVFGLVREVGAGPAVASAVAAAVVGFVSESTAPRLRVPAIVASVCGIVPLLPGLAIYRGLFQIVQSPELGLIPGAQGLVNAMMIGLGIAAGVTLGEFVARPLRLGTRRRRGTRVGSTATAARVRASMRRARADVPTD